jgi:uncharacterized DUF497 family protein
MENDIVGTIQKLFGEKLRGPNFYGWSPNICWHILIAKKLQYNYNVVMSDLRFVWDPQKAASNKRTHGVTFSEAATVFTDENAGEYPDPDHSEDEKRFIILGLSAGLRVLVVCYCYRHPQAIIRIISARKATPQECRFYGENVQ